MADIEIRQENVELYARRWIAGAPMSGAGVTEPERQVALVLAGYDTPGHARMLGISDDARAFAAQHWPDGLG